MHRGGGGGAGAGAKAYALHRDRDDDADWSGSKHHKAHRRSSWRRGGRGSAGASAMLWTALVAGGFLLFLATFLDVNLNPFSSSRQNEPASLVSTSSSSSSAAEPTDAAAAAAPPAAGRGQKHEEQERPRKKKGEEELQQHAKKVDVEEKEEDGASSASRGKKGPRPAPKQEQAQEQKEEEEPVAAAAPAEDVDAAVAAFLERARKENVEKRVELTRSEDKGDGGDGEAPIETLPRVAVLFCPTEQPAALALTKALEAALLEDDEEDPIAVEEVLAAEAAGEEDGWLIRVEGNRRAAAHDGSTTGPPSDFLLWFTSRVPPYGYGKSHGLSGIVRLLAFPPIHPLESDADARDWVRWHCRVSHVTAHTATLTLEVGAGDGMGEGDGPGSDWAERLWGFLGLGPASLPAAQDALRDELAAAGVVGSGADDDDDDAWALLQREQQEGEEEDEDDDAWALLQREQQEGEEEDEDDDDGGRGLLPLKEEAEGALPPELLAVLVEEVAVMTQWPCGQFEDPQLGPACHLTSWVHCSVPWDVCGKASCDGEEGKAER